MPAYSNISNGVYSVCCMGQTVYVYAKNGTELARFTLPNADVAVISPVGDVFAVKTKDGRLAEYSLEKLTQIEVIDTDVDDTLQDGGICYSNDGRQIYNIEKSNGKSVISIYSTKDLSLVGKIADSYDFEQLEAIDNTLVVLAKRGDEKLVLEIVDGEVVGQQEVTDEKYDLYLKFKFVQLRGFTSEITEQLFPKTRNINEMKYTLSDLL